MLYPLAVDAVGLVPSRERDLQFQLVDPQCGEPARLHQRAWFGLSRSFDTFFVNSLTVSLLCVVGNLAACSLTAFAFARLEFKGKGLWFALMLGTLMLPYQVTLIPQYVLFLNIGWVNTFLPLVVPKFLAADSFFIFLMCSSSAAFRASSTRRR